MATHLGKIMVIILLHLLGACSGVGQVVTPPSPLTFVPPPALRTEGDCTLTSTLETWLQSVTLRQREFARYIDEADSKSREVLYADVERMGQIISAISSIPAPSCAEFAQQTVIQAMVATATEFQAYVNRDREDLSSIIADAQREIANANVALQGLTTQLEQQYETIGE